MPFQRKQAKKYKVFNAKKLLNFNYLIFISLQNFSQ